MKRMMRYNNFQNDPLSTQNETCQHIGWTNCTPSQTSENTIACRDDLNPANGVYALSAFGQRNHAATDAKISAYSQFDNFTLPSLGISGPTYDQQAPFVFSESPYAHLIHEGIPDKMAFPWMIFSWDE